MNVNKITINLKTLNSETGTTINIPIGNNFQLVDQEDIIESKFIQSEINKSINTTLDYDKIRFKPITSNNQLIENITYNVHFLNANNQFNQYSYYGDVEIGFNDSDIKFRKKGFTGTFLRLNFYDSDIPTNQRLLSFITLFTKINQSDISDGSVIPWGDITPVNNLKIQFNLGNNLVDRSLNGEGFFIYYYKDEVTQNLPKELYMRAEFNNAKTGKITNLMSTSSTNKRIDQLITTTQGNTPTNNIFTKYILKNINDQYYYELDTTYSTNIQLVNNDYTVDLYQITAI
jgi:hypothetical protein